jgi:hypothetical protein
MRSSLLLIAMFASPVLGQSPIVLQEKLPIDAAYHVSCRVQISGKLPLGEKALDVEGKSVIEYDERVLRVNKDGVVDKTARLVSRMEFERKAGAEPVKIELRPVVSRLVMLRQDNIEAPFSPDGPLKIQEVDLIRTDVFTPALAGLLPKNGVVPGDTWKADDGATRELTDLSQITSGALTCRFDKIDGNLAKISFSGAIDGQGENGPTRHELEGFVYFDTGTNLLTYVSLKGTEHLQGEKGQAGGKVSGTFVLTREPRSAPSPIAETAKMAVDPDRDNTRLLFEDDETGVRLLYSRNWKPRVETGQVKLDDLRGNGLVITPDPLKSLPALNQLLNEARSGIERRKGTVTFAGPTQTIQQRPTAVESLTMEASVPSDKETKRGTMVLSVIRDEAAGATLAATLVTSDRAAVVQEIERMAMTVRVMRTK